MAKYPNWTGRIEALLNVLGGEEVVDALIAGTKVAEIKDAVRMLFDRHGRCIPPQGMKAEVVDANRDFHLTQPEVNFAERLARLTRFLTNGETPISAEEFERRTAEIVRRVKGDKLLVNLFCGVFLPIVLPQIAIGDYGKTLDLTLLPAVGRAYEAEFAGRKFYNHRQGTLAGEVTVVKGSRHEALVAAIAAGPVVALYFPTALQGFSIPADLEQMAMLPDFVLPTGALEPAAAMVMYPDVLARDGQTPGLDCAALSWRGGSLYFKADGDNLLFNGGGLSARGNYSGGLVVLG
ncbi:hypothetical protein HZB93_04425 [Candidatus Falkowbacteria bacterium]|nr:hypothetical protein [Candidatus Falkowbacteria bacterium]